MKDYKLKPIIRFILLYIITLYTHQSIGIQTIDTIAAIINQEIILESDIENAKKLYTKHQINDFYTKKHDNPPSRKDILDQLITDTIILQLSQRANINITEEQLNQIIQYIETHNNMTNKQLKTYLKNHDIDYSTYKNYIKKNALIDIMCDYEMQRRIKILPYELKTLTRQLILKKNNTEFQLDHIFIPIKENASANQIEEAYLLGIMLKKSIKNGINIKLLPEIYSKYNKSQTIKINRINWCTIEELPTLFSKHLSNYDVKVNDIIGPIRSSAGFHILKIHNIYFNKIKNIKKNTVTKIHIRHIMLKTSQINNDQINRTKLLKIAEQIKNHHTTFSIEAKQISEDTDSSIYGGDLGWKYLEDFDQTLHPLLLSLKKGEISSPIKTSNGWHLIELINIKNVDKDEIVCQEHAKQIILNKKIHEEMKDWIQELKISTYIKIFHND